MISKNTAQAGIARMPDNDLQQRALAGGIALYRERLDQFTEFILLLDASAQVVVQSESARAFLGYSLADFRGRSVVDFVHPEEQQEASEALARVLSGNNRMQRPEMRILKKDGSWLCAEILASNHLSDPSIRAIVLMLRDISERKDTERKVVSSRELFATAFHSSNDMCAITVPSSGEFVDVNRKWLETFGYDRSEVIGKTSVELCVWGSEKDRNNLLQAFSTTGSLNGYESQIRTKSGELRDVLVSTEELDVMGEKRLYFSARDVTEEKIIAEQLRHSQKMEAVGQLTGGIAHDFNNLLGVILGNTELLKTEIGKSSEYSSYLDEILKATDRGSKLTRRLLAFSRKQTLRPQEFYPHLHLAQMLELLRRSLGEDIEIEIVNGPTLWSCYADPVQFENVILNIALNARDAMRDGGQLRLGVENVTVDDAHTDSLPGDYVRISVQDSGSGMTPEVVERVFEPFFTTKEVGKGTGLGLSMVFGFVKQSGGYVAIESEPGAGTLVKFMLPRFRQNKLG